MATVNIDENEIVTEGALTKSGTSFHFPLENVINIVEQNDIDTEEMVQQLENRPILELVQPLSATTTATSPGSSTTASSHETVPDTQNMQQPPIYPVLQKDINLIRQFLAPEMEEPTK